jgi:hypothetical protein
MMELALESSVCSSLELFEPVVPVRSASPARRAITLSPSILRLLRTLVAWLGAVIVLLVITSMMHYTTAAAAESYLCMRH